MRNIEGIIQTEGDSNEKVAKVAMDEMVVNVEVSRAVLGESIMKKAKFCI